MLTEINQFNTLNQTKGNIMPTVNLPDSYDQKLAQLVTISNPFEPPTRESVLTELIDAELARRQNGKESHTVPSTNGNGIHLNADA